MFRLHKVVLAALLCLLPVSADSLTPEQVQSMYWYSSAYSFAASSAASVFTVQVNGTSSRIVYLRAVTVQSSVALTGVKLEVAGTAATATAGTVVKLNTSLASDVGSFTVSDVGTGTTVFTFDIPAGVPVTLDLSGMTFNGGASTTRNATIRTPSTTANVYTLFKWGQAKR